MPSAPSPDLPDVTERLLTPREAARIVGVDPKTVIRWEEEGRLTSLRTLGGHRRYPRDQIDRLAHAASADEEIVTALEKVRTRALEKDAHREAELIARLLLSLGAPST